MDKEIIDEQMSAVKKGYDYQILPPELRFSKEEAEELLDFLRNKSERLFVYTGLVYTWADSLEELVVLKTIANSLQRRVSANYRFVLTFNSALIALGAMGILQPASSAILHNLSTIGISLKSMTNLIPEEKAQKALAEKN